MAAMSWLFGNGASSRREREARDAEVRRLKLVAAGLLDNHPQGTAKQFVQDEHRLPISMRSRAADRSAPPTGVPPAPPRLHARGAHLVCAERAEYSNKARPIDAWSTQTRSTYKDQLTSAGRLRRSPPRSRHAQDLIRGHNTPPPRRPCGRVPRRSTQRTARRSARRAAPQLQRRSACSC